MTERIPFDTAPQPLRLRVEDFLLLDEAGAFSSYGKTELVGGDIFFMNAQHRPHMMAKGELAFRIRLALEAIASNLAVGIEGSFRLSDHDLPEPDILLTDQPHGTGPVPKGSVALVVEVADASLDFDLGPKAALYAGGGVPEYWVADLGGRVVHPFWSTSGQSYVERRSIPFGAPIAAATIDGLTVPTAAL